jgi:hypothetical protein
MRVHRSMLRGGAIVAMAAGVLGMAQAAIAQCAEWVSTGASYPAYLANDGLGQPVLVDHDGDGPLPVMLYAAKVTYWGGNNGNFSYQSLAAASLAGGTALNPPIVQVDNAVYSPHVLSEATAGIAARTLIVAGRFRSTDGSIVNLGAWDGVTFRDIGGPSAPFAQDVPLSVTSGDPDGDGPLPRCIIVSGQFQTFRGVAAPLVAAWDGQQWRSLGEGLGSYWASVFTLDMDGPGPEPRSVFAFARRSLSEPIVAFKCTASGWIEIWRGVSQVPVWHDPDGAGPMPGMLRTATARWTGNQWEALNEVWPTDFPGGPQTIQSIDLDGDGPLLPQLVTNGLWTGVGATRWRRFAVLGLDGWDFPPGPFNDSSSSVPTYVSYGLRAGFVHDPDGSGPRGNEFVMITAGPGTGGPNYANAGHFVSWDGHRLRTYKSGFHYYSSESGAQAQVWSMFAHDADGAGPEPKRLFTSGGFREVWGQPSAGLAVYRDGLWQGLGNPANLYHTRWLTEHDHDGDPRTAPWLVGMMQPWGPSGNPFVARWTGSAWERAGDLASGVAGIGGDREVFAYSFDEDGPGPQAPSLFAASNVPNLWFTRLSGNSWISTGTPPSALFFYVTSFDADGPGGANPTLFAMERNGIHRWSGLDWFRIPTLLSVDNPDFRWNSVVLDPDGPGPRRRELIVTGHTVRTSHGTFYGAAGYDGSNWRAVGPANPPNFPVQAFRSAWLVDVDGPGPDPEELILCGTESVKWLHHGAWVTIPIVATGVRGFEFGVEGPMPNELWFTGAFTEVGGLPASGFARWRLATPVSIDSQPVNQWASRTGDASFAVMVSGSSPTYQWRRNGVPINNGPGGAVVGGGVVAGARSNILTIQGVRCVDEGVFDCVVANSCRTTNSMAATLGVFNCCPADLDNDGSLANGSEPDGAVEASDLLYFLVAFDAGASAADLDDDGDPASATRDGAVTIEDLLYFVAHFEAGC